MPTAPRTQPPDVRRDQLLDAAEQVFLSQGLRATTVADVAAAAGLAKGTVYLHFDSKDALVAALRRRYLDRADEALQAASADVEEPLAHLSRLIHALFEFGARNHDMHHLLFHEAGFSEDDAFEPVRLLFAGVIAEGIRRGDIEAGDTDIATDFVVGSMHDALIRAMHGKPARRKRVADETVRLLIRALATH